MKKLMVMASLVVMLAMAASTHASVAFYEGFGYTSGDQLLAHNYFDGGTTGSVYVTESGSIPYDGLVTSGNKAYIAPASGSGAVIRVLPTAVTNLFTTPGTFYISYLMYGGGQTINFGVLNNTVSPTGLTDYVVQHLQYALPGWWGWQYRFLAGGADGGYHTYPNDANQIGPHLIAWKIQIDANPANDTIQTVIDPALNAGEPIWSTMSYFSATANVSKSVNGLLIDGNHNPTGTTNVDEIRIATTWAEVAPVPEPGGLLALGVGAIGILGWIRRRSTH